MPGSLLLFLESKHLAAERRIFEFLGPPPFVSLDSEMTTVGLQLVEVNAATPLRSTAPTSLAAGPCRPLGIGGLLLTGFPFRGDALQEG